MAELYIRTGQVGEEPRYERVNFMLSERLTSDKDGYFSGMRFIQGKTKDFSQWLESWKKKLEKMEFSAHEIETKLGLLDSSHIFLNGKRLHMATVTTEFAGIKYLHLDGCPFTNFISDKSIDAIANIKPEDKIIEIFPYNERDCRPKYPYFYDVAKAMGDGGLFYYTGSLRDALQEFQECGFRFNKMRWPTTQDVLSRKFNLSKDVGILVSKDIYLEEVLN